MAKYKISLDALNRAGEESSQPKDVKPLSRREQKALRLQKEEDEKKKKLQRRRLLYWGVPAGVILLAVATWSLGSKTPVSKEPVWPEARQRLNKLYTAYKAYCDRNHKAPSGEQVLKDFVQKLSPADRDGMHLPENPDELFVNPRDSQKYEFKWGAMPDQPTAALRAIGWEKTSDADGLRWVILGNGYIDHYSDVEVADLKK
jgi:hypothetical protein